MSFSPKTIGNLEEYSVFVKLYVTVLIFLISIPIIQILEKRAPLSLGK